MNDPIEQRHNATNARIRAEAKAGKYWLVRCEARKELIDKIIENTMAANIGVVDMPMGGRKSDPAFGGRNKFNKRQLRFAIGQLRNQKSSR